MPKARKKRCRHCGEDFMPANTMQKACSITCAHALGKRAVEKREQDRAKQLRRQHRIRKESIKPRAVLLREAQAAFNAYVRARDEGKPCISCGLHPQADPLRGGVWDCGHYRSTGAAAHLRFEPLNAHRQCKRCNRDRSGNVTDYRINLEYRIGSRLLSELEANNDITRLTTEHLRTIRHTYRTLTRAITNKKPIDMGQFDRLSLLVENDSPLVIPSDVSRGTSL